MKHSQVADTRVVEDLECSIALLQLSLSFLTVVDHSFAALATLLVLHTCSNTEDNKLEISFGIAVILVFDSCCYGEVHVRYTGRNTTGLLLWEHYSCYVAIQTATNLRYPLVYVQCSTLHEYRPARQAI